MGRLLSTDLLFPLKVSARVGDQQRSIRRRSSAAVFFATIVPRLFYFYAFPCIAVSFFLFFKRGGDRSEKSWLFIPVSFHAPFISIHCSPFFLFLFLRVRTPLHALRRLTNATAWAISEVASCFFRDRIINITILFPFYAVNELRYVFCKYTQLFQTTTNN